MVQRGGIAPKAAEVRDWILRDGDGKPRWVFQLAASVVSGGVAAAFLPSGILDWFDLEADPIGPPEGRVRLYFKGGALWKIIGPFGVPIGAAVGSLGLADLTDVDDGTAPAAGLILTGHDAIGPASAHWDTLAAGPAGYVLQLDPGVEGGLVWAPMGLGATPAAIPGFHLLGDPLNYSEQGSVDTAGEIQYTRVWLLKDQVFEFGRVFQVQGGSLAREFRIGIYDQADPAADTGEPNDRIAQTLSTTTPAAANGTYRDIAWVGGDYTIPATGWYWLAFVADTTTPLQFSISPGPYPAGFLPIRRESSAGTTLPATASGLTNPASSVAFLAIKEA